MNKWINEFIKESFGFESLWAVFKDSLLIKIQYIPTFILSLLTSIWIVVWEGFMDYVSDGTGPFGVWITNNVYDPNQAIKWLFIFVVIDNLLGIYKARSIKLVGGIIKPPEELASGKFLKSWIRLGVQVIFVMSLHNLNLLYPYLQIGIVTHGVMIAFLIATFASAWNNAYATELIAEEVHHFVMSILDLRKILRIFKPKHLSKETDDTHKKGSIDDWSAKKSDQ